MRISQTSANLPLLRRGKEITIKINGQAATAYEGETVAGALLAEKIRVFHQTRQGSAPRGLFCGMGICYDCLVTIDGRSNLRACVTPVSDGMAIETRSDVTKMMMETLL